MTGWGSEQKSYEMETEEFGTEKLKNLIKEHEMEIKSLSKMHNEGIISYDNLMENSTIHNNAINSLEIELKESEESQ